MRVWAPILLAAFLTAGHMSGQGKPASGNAASMERKLEHIVTNGSAAHPDAAPTLFTEDEINAYFATGEVDLPAGVRSVHFEAEPGVVRATTRVDFDQVQAGRSSLNPLLSIFSGVHDTVVTAEAHGAGGVGYVQVDSVSLDGVEIPRFVLQLFVQKYLQPKYPDIGLDSKFPLPDRIDNATVGAHTLTVVQK
jgi:hypothetical protein